MLSARLLFAVALIASCSLGQQPLFAELRRMFPWDNDNSLSIAAADVDQDGDVDVIIGNSGHDRLYLNDGTGAFTDASASLPPDNDMTTAVAAGDLDGDGDVDLLFGNSTSARLLLQVAPLVFVDASAQLPALPGGGRCIALADLDGDGDLDAMIGSTWANGTLVRLWLNGGAANFTDVTALSVPAFAQGAYCPAIRIGDLDGDGDKDALVANPGFQNRLLLNDGSGTFVDASSQLPPSVDFTTDVALVDLDGDQDLDVVLANVDATNPSSYVLVNSGAAVFTGPFFLPPAIPTSSADRSVAATDVDNDGDVDVLVTAAGSKVLYLNNGAGGLTVASSFPANASSDWVTRLVMADVDGDLDPDLIVAVSGGPSRLYLNDGTAAFSNSGRPIPVQPGVVHDIAIVDVDGDGDRDLFLAGAKDHLWLNNGNGTFTDATLQLPSIIIPPQLLPAGSVKVAAGDVTGDGVPDFLTGGPYGNLLYLNNGQGTFFNGSVAFPWTAGARTAVILCDVDGDGDKDAFIAGLFPSGHTKLLINSGFGTFSPAPQPLPTPDWLVSAFAAGDLDGDGDVDLLRINCALGSACYSAQDQLWLNDGFGGFTDGTAGNLPVESMQGSSVALGDVDGDGDLDALIGNFSGPPALWLNLGPGFFVDVSSVLPPIVASTFDVQLVDVDGDGDLDAILGNVPSPQSGITTGNTLWLNNGAAVFTDATNLLPPSEGSVVRAADIDGDDDVDLVVASNSGEPRVFYGTRRHVGLRALARIGKPLTLELFGPPNGTWCVAVDSTASPSPAPPWGTLWLSPATGVIFACGMLDAQGMVALTIPIPSDSSLIGPSFYLQGVAAFPLHLTNLEIATFSSL